PRGTSAPRRRASGEFSLERDKSSRVVDLAILRAQMQPFVPPGRDILSGKSASTMQNQMNRQREAGRVKRKHDGAVGVQSGAGARLLFAKNALSCAALR